MTFVSEYAKTFITVKSLVSLSASNSNRSTGSQTLNITLPASTNTVSISLSLTGNNQASLIGVLASVVELSSEMFLNSNLQRNSSSSNETKYSSTLTPYKLASNVVTVQVASVLSNQSLVSTLLPTFEMTLTLSDSAYNHSDPIFLSLNCSVGVKETSAMQCQQSHVWMNMTCTGQASAVVHRRCPVSKHICSVLNLETNTIASNDYCKAVTIGSVVLCRCGYDNLGQNSNATAALLALNGHISVAAFSSFASSDLDASVAVVDVPFSDEIAKQSMLVFVTFSGMWSLGIVFLTITNWSYINSRWKLTPATNKNSLDLSDVEDVQSRLLTYCKSILPPVLHPSTWWVIRWVKTIMVRHLYVRTVCCSLRFGGMLFVDRTWTFLDRNTRKRVMFDIGMILTSLTMSCFVLAVFYDLQSPVDDGYCSSQMDEPTCLYRKTLFDPYVDTCIWVEPQKVSAAIVTESLYGTTISTVSVTPESGKLEDIATKSCRINENTNTTLSFLVSFVVASLVGNLVGYIVEYLFAMLDEKDDGDEIAVSDKCTIGKGFLSMYQSLRVNQCFSHCSQHQVGVSDSVLESSPMSEYQRLNCVAVANFQVSDDIVEARYQLLGNDEVETCKDGMLLLHFLLADMNIMHPFKAFPFKQKQRQLFLSLLPRWFGAHRHSSSYFKRLPLLLITLLFMIHAGALYFLVTKAAVRGYSWQISFFKATISEWMSDIFVSQSIEILILDCMLPSSCLYEDTQRHVETLLENAYVLSEPSKSKSNSLEDERVVTIDALTWTSVLLANHFYYVAEARLVQQIYFLMQAFQDNVLEGAKVPVLHGRKLWQQSLVYFVAWWSPWILESLVSSLTTFAMAFIFYLWFTVIAPSASGGSHASLGLVVFTWVITLTPIGSSASYLVANIFCCRHGKAHISKQSMAKINGKDSKHLDMLHNSFDEDDSSKNLSMSINSIGNISVSECSTIEKYCRSSISLIDDA